jgi:hypothetical protein
MILVYEKDQRTLRSLRTFFKKRKYLKAEFTEDMASLEERSSRSKGKNICIISGAALPKLKPRKLHCSCIATVSGGSQGTIEKRWIMARTATSSPPSTKKTLNRRSGMWSGTTRNGSA